MTTPDGAAAHLVAEPLQQIQARFDTGSGEAHGVRRGCRTLAPARHYSPPCRDEQYDGLEYGGLPVKAIVFIR
jgi:hypothetical protein